MKNVHLIFLLVRIFDNRRIVIITFDDWTRFSTLIIENLHFRMNSMRIDSVRRRRYGRWKNIVGNLLINFIQKTFV